MRSAAVIAASAALVAGANAHYNGTVEYTTEVLTAYTTYCPAATSVVHNSKTYTVTEATTLTITDCPCTVTKPVYTSPVVPATSPISPVVPTTSAVVSSVVVETTPVPVVESSTPLSPIETSAPVVPVVPSVSPAPYPTTSAIYINSTVPAGPTGVSSAPVGSGTAPAGSPSSTSPNSPSFTGAGNKVAASGLSLAGLLALAAYLL